MISPATLHRMIESYRQSRRNAIRTGIIFYLIIVIPVQYGIMIITSGKIVQFNICIYNHRTTKTNQKYPSVNL